RGIPLSARDDTGVLSQARPMLAAGARRGRRRCGAAAPKVRKSKYFISRSSSAHCALLFLIISHYLSLFLIISHPISPLQYLCNVEVKQKRTLTNPIY
ncbi:MAG: hypothetical protein IKJ09_11970, partial [Bacteroidaceae bacterium]|nr:hypothetical protein [Bacteroidaceae bacterium]